MRKELLKLVPKRFLCPYCGKWHDWDYYDNLEAFNGDDGSKADFTCYDISSDGSGAGSYSVYFNEGYLYYSTERICGRANQEMNGRIPISSIIEDPDRHIVTFDVQFTSDHAVGSYECRACSYEKRCNYVRLGDKRDNIHMTIKLGFEFEESEYEEIIKNVQKDQEIKQEEIMGDDTMSKSVKTSILTMLYEKSPKDNIGAVKAWAEKYKPVLRWAIPVATVYGAYRILNSKEFDFSVNNIADTCEKQLGFKIEFLEDKKALKELMVLGGLSAGAYGAMKAVSGILGAQEKEDITVEEVESGMKKLDAISKKFSWIQPKTEDMLPIAFSVIFVYVALHKPKFTGKIADKVKLLTEDFKIRIGIYLSLAKDFISDKFNMDLADENEQKRLKICVLLMAMVGIFVFLYGKKVLGDKTEENDAESSSKSVKAFVEKAKVIMEKMAPTVYTTLITFLVSKKLLQLQENEEENSEGQPVELSEEENEQISFEE